MSYVFMIREGLYPQLLMLMVPANYRQQVKGRSHGTINQLKNFGKLQMYSLS